ncbi:MAG TPA: tetratricopeptide repeat protein [Alphaproteobacteria bacterium]
MEDGRTERKLAAILAADVVGYSRLMSLDEEGTLRRLKSYLGELVEPPIAAHRGRIVKRTGDGLLVDFASPVEAVRCAVAIQTGVAGRNDAAADGNRIEFRIGINLGDVIIEGDDIYGDGVNLAARLEAIADPGAIFVSRAVRDFVRDKLDYHLEDLGERQVKNIAKPVRVFRVGGVGRATSATAITAAATMPDKPSIAVLPFANMSGDAEQEYFSDGITEDLITDLSKISGLFVVARNSSFAYKNKPTKVQDIGRDLGVRYVLEGSIRKAGNRVRITGQLIDAETGGHLWADRFDRELTDIFETQDEVVHKIVDALAVKLTRSEERRISRRGTDNVEAYESWLRAREQLGRGTRESVAEARRLHRRAIEIDPKFAAPHAGLALVAGIEYVNGWADPLQAFEEAERWARRALELDSQEPVAHMGLGNILLWQRQHDRALASFRRMIELEPSFAQGHGATGMALTYAGRGEEAIGELETAMRLDPHYPSMVLHFLAQALFSVGRYEEAAEKLCERIARTPTTDSSRMLLASCYGHLGRLDEARGVWAELLEVNPDFSLAQRQRVLPFKNPTDFQRIVDGLAKAGLP